MEQTKRPTAPAETVEAPKKFKALGAPATLVEEILETTNERDRLGLVDWSDAIDRLEQRAKALTNLARAAIAETEPHQWVRFESKDGSDRLRMKVGAAMTICTYFGITVKPDPAVIAKDDDVGEKFALVTGSAHCNATGIRIPVRAKRFAHEDFVGRKIYTRGDGSETGTNVGVQDVIDSAISLFITKSAILLSGIHSISPARAAKIWDLTVDQVIAAVDAGHGSKRGKSTNGSSAGRTATEAQFRMLWAKAKKRLEAIGSSQIEPDTLVDEAIIAICGKGTTRETCPIAKVTPIVEYIDSYGGDQ